MSHFRDIPIGTKVTFRLRPFFDLRHPRDAHRYKRAVEQRLTVGRPGKERK